MSTNDTNFFLITDDTGTDCLGSIPTFHREIVSSTAKISHSRIIKEHRTKTEAQRFHEIMKSKT